MQFDCHVNKSVDVLRQQQQNSVAGGLPPAARMDKTSSGGGVDLTPPGLGGLAPAGAGPAGVVGGEGTGEELALEVTCGQNTACLYMSRLQLGSKGTCVLFDNAWLTPNEFQYVSGRETAKDWKRSIKHFGKSLKVLIAKGILLTSPMRCNCGQCGSPKDKSKIRDDLKTAPVNKPLAIPTDTPTTTTINHNNSSSNNNNSNKTSNNNMPHNADNSSSCRAPGSSPCVQQQASNNTNTTCRKMTPQVHGSSLDGGSYSSFNSREAMAKKNNSCSNGGSGGGSSSGVVGSSGGVGSSIAESQDKTKNKVKKEENHCIVGGSTQMSSSFRSPGSAATTNDSSCNKSSTNKLTNGSSSSHTNSNNNSSRNFSATEIDNRDASHKNSALNGTQSGHNNNNGLKPAHEHKQFSPSLSSHLNHTSAPGNLSNSAGLFESPAGLFMSPYYPMLGTPQLPAVYYNNPYVMWPAMSAASAFTTAASNMPYSWNGPAMMSESAQDGRMRSFMNNSAKTSDASAAGMPPMFSFPWMKSPYYTDPRYGVPPTPDSSQFRSDLLAGGKRKLYGEEDVRSAKQHCSFPADGLRSSFFGDAAAAAALQDSNVNPLLSCVHSSYIPSAAPPEAHNIFANNYMKSAEHCGGMNMYPNWFSSPFVGMPSR